MTSASPSDPPQVVIVSPDGRPVSQPPGDTSPSAAAVPDDADDQSSPGPLVEQPDKVMRIGTMMKQLLEEVRSAPLDEASRARLREVHEASIRELERGIGPELRAELGRVRLPFEDDEVPSDAELRVAHAQLVGWLEGLFHGIQAAMVAQQLAARGQLEEVQRRALPPGSTPGGPQQGAQQAPPAGGTGNYL